MNKKVLKVGNLSTGNSQAGTHGYALGYIVVNKKKASKKQNKM